MTEDVHLWAGLFAADALEGEELARYEQHLVHCPDCQLEVLGFRETLAELALATAEAPPPAVRQRVLDEVSRTRQTKPPVADVTPLTGRRKRAVVQMAVAAALTLLVGVGALLIIDANHRADEAEQLAALLAR